MSDNVTNPKPVTRIALLLDASGSMQRLRAQAFSTFNDYLTSMREGSDPAQQDTSISVYTFATSVRDVMLNVPAQRARSISEGAYRPDGNTALFEAVAKAINDFQAMPDAGAEHVSCLILAITDGEENASWNWPANKLKKLLADVHATERYTVAFLVPRGAAQQLAALDLPAGNIREWEVTTAGLNETSRAVGASFKAYSASRSTGTRSTRAFFTDVASVSRADVQAACRDISSTVQVFKVSKAEDIRTFYERVMGAPYIKGQAFYELTKSEEIQHHKDVMIVEEGRTAVYSGAEARRLIGLPDYKDVKVKPGDHGKWSLFIQSTSVNRKLQPGTRVICLNRA